MDMERKKDKEEEECTIDFLEVHIPEMKRKMHDQVEKKLLQLRNHLDRLTGKLRRFLNSR
jgi:hypothetical protein